MGLDYRVKCCPDGLVTDRRRRIRVLDCTIRDGGICNDWQFSDDLVQRTFQALTQAGVDYMEVGYLTRDGLFDADKVGPWRFCREEDLERVVHVPGVIGVRDLRGLRTEVIGVSSERAPATALSFERRELVTTETANTIIDGVSTRRPDPAAMAIIWEGASRFVQISDEDAAVAMRMMFRATHQLPCLSGAAALAALMSERERWRGKRVGVVMTSSNVDTDVAAEVLAGGVPSLP